MGLSKFAVSALLFESKRNPLGGSILTLGRQDVWFDFNTLQKIAKKYQFELKEISNITLNQKAFFSRNNFINDKCLFSALGFDTVSSLDFSDNESPNIIFDLNSSGIPESLKNSFDVIIDGGTLEHVFHLPNAMKNIFAMLKVGGRIIHISPSSNLVDHGFYMFSPTLFFDYYTANRFEINSINLIRYSQNADTDPWDFYKYTPENFEKYSFGGLDGAMYGIFCIATKTDRSTNDVIPIQGFYQNNPKNCETNVESKRSIKKIIIERSRADNFLSKFLSVCIKEYSQIRYKLSRMSKNNYCKGKKPDIEPVKELFWDRK